MDWAGSRARLVREAARVVGSGDAEDAAQEALIRAWRFADRLQDPDRVLPWMLQITRREALRMRARRSPLEVLAAPAEVEELGDAEASAEAEEAWTLLDALASLSEKDRRLLAFRFTDDLSHAEIGSRLDIGPGAVRVRLHRVIGSLRQRMSDADGTS